MFATALKPLFALLKRREPQTPHEQGRAAYQNGIESNPYQPSTVEHEEWERGYTDARLDNAW